MRFVVGLARRAAVVRTTQSSMDKGLPPFAATAALALALLLGTPAGAATHRAALGDGRVAALTEKGEIYLEAPPLKGEGLYAFTRRFTGSTRASSRIARLNGRPRRLLAGVRYRVPYELLLGEHRLDALQGLFPDDRLRADGWHHTVSKHSRGESLWRLGEWLTGRGESFKALREHNRLRDDTLRPGQKLLIPADLLLPALRAALPPVEVVPDAATAHGLAYEHDETGDYAVYRLARGEALYSAVVVRFTGGTFAEDVNALAAELADLNGIADVTEIPVGRRIRIPFDLLLPELLPADHPRRVEVEKDRSERDKHSNTVRASRLEGITVILDAGHGGQDPGVMPSGVWESVYVYDIMVRIKHLLETTTAAVVVPTTRDGNQFQTPERDVLPRSRGHSVLTTPPYPIDDARVAANLRWYLANSRYSRAKQENGDDAKTIFLSIHADSLPRSYRGAMAYIPATSLTQGEYGKSGSVYQTRQEYREQPRVSYSWKQRTRSEGLSRQLAGELLASFRGQDLAVHPEKPIRDRIIRCRRCRPWVPAVVRYNAVPSKLLLEVCNLNNSEDRRLLQTRAFRQRVAEAIVDGILAYYGQATGGGTPLVASAAR